MCGGVDNSLSTGLEFDQDEDLMDVPDFFGEAPRMPRERRSPRRSTTTTPRTKDASVRLPGGIMADVEALASARGDVITGGSEGYSGDGVHASTSQHYTGTALDVRYTGQRAQQIADYRRTGMVVIPEADHLHIQAYPVRA
jgi:hypothetical protein